MTAILVLAICALIFVIGLIGFGAVAREERSAAQHAADAAALAGAEMILDTLPGRLLGFAQLTDLLDQLPGHGPCRTLGDVRARQLAVANAAELEEYCWEAARDRVRVKVRLNHAAEGEQATASAEAETRFSLSDCQIAADFVTPTPTPIPTPTPPPTGPSPTPTPPSPSPPRSETSVTCGFVTLRVIFDLPTLRFTFLDLDQKLSDLRPRLVA